MARLKSNLKNKAFSLLELIITVGIVSTGIVFILQALSFCARVTGLSCDITNAVFLAEDRVQELAFKERKNQITNEQKDAKLDKFTWNYTIDLDPDLITLYKLNFDITWQRLNREERLNLSTYLKNSK